MLLQSFVAALATGLFFEAIASPAAHDNAVKVKRISASHSLHERHLPHWEHQWSKKSKVPESQVLPMRIGFKQRNLEAGHDKLMDM